MRPVECAQAQIVETVVVFARQPGSAFGLLPNPFPEAVLDLLQLLAPGDRLLLVDDARAVFPLVIRRGRAPVESVLDKVGGAEARGAVSRRVADVPPGRGIDFESPGRDRFGVSDADIVGRYVQ